jgi:hypothetical protein
MLDKKKINGMSYEDQIKVIRSNPFNLRYIEKPSIELQLIAIRINPYSISCIVGVTREVEQEALKLNPDVLRNIDGLPVRKRRPSKNEDLEMFLKIQKMRKKEIEIL